MKKKQVMVNMPESTHERILEKLSLLPEYAKPNITAFVLMAVESYLKVLDEKKVK